MRDSASSLDFHSFVHCALHRVDKWALSAEDSALELDKLDEVTPDDSPKEGICFQKIPTAAEIIISLQYVQNFLYSKYDLFSRLKINLLPIDQQFHFSNIVDLEVVLVRKN